MFFYIYFNYFITMNKFVGSKMLFLISAVVLPIYISTHMRSTSEHSKSITYPSLRHMKFSVFLCGYYLLLHFLQNILFLHYSFGQIIILCHYSKSSFYGKDLGNLTIYFFYHNPIVFFKISYGATSSLLKPAQ